MFPTESWWTSRQLELVENRSISWVEQTFAASGAISFETATGRITRKAEPGESVVQPESWDHEHCALCWAEISLHPGKTQRGYTNGAEWLCLECYVHFIVPREQGVFS
jgi:hypothetical protein